MNIERVIKFLAGGLSPTQVASIVGCSASRISQLLSQPENKERLAAAKLEAGAAGDDADAEELLEGRYLAVEHALLNQMSSQIPFAELRDCTNALRAISERQEKKATRLLQARAMKEYSQHGSVTVSLTVPVHVLPAPVFNEAQEIVAIGNQPMAPLSADAVRSLFATRKLGSWQSSSLERSDSVSHMHSNSVLEIPPKAMANAPQPPNSKHSVLEASDF